VFETKEIEVFRPFRIAVPVLLLIALVAVSGCKKKIPPTPVATAPPPAPSPTANLSASPSTVNAGERVVLTWNTANASTISIDGIGTVTASGSKTVTPGGSTTYHLVARGDGGTADASAHVNVNMPQAAAAPASSMSDADEFKANIRDVYFDYDKYSIRSDAQTVLAKDASYLASHPRVKILIGGYCDERGSEEYNLALGENRASSAQKALEEAGVAANRIRVISYGKDKQFCMQDTESCYQENRRDGFSMDN
jgi:peptidoglycan-associated lipoprotein